MSGPAGVEVRLVERIEELHSCEAVAKLVWQVDDREIVPASHLRALQHAGGMVAGAFDGGRMIGFLVGFLARHEPSRSLGLHSHLLAVLPDYRRSGVGRALKWYQRRWCLDHDLPWITWTFDPLQGQNARLNLEQLGARGREYMCDFYGTLGGVVYGALATDRLLVRWDLDAPHVLRLAGGALPGPPDEGSAPTALSIEASGRPGREDLRRTEPWVRVAVPPRFAPLLYEDPDGASAWRDAMRRVMVAYHERGYRAHRFHDGHYLLRRE